MGGEEIRRASLKSGLVDELCPGLVVVAIGEGRADIIGGRRDIWRRQPVW